MKPVAYEVKVTACGRRAKVVAVVIYQISPGATYTTAPREYVWFWSDEPHFEDGLGEYVAPPGRLMRWLGDTFEDRIRASKRRVAEAAELKIRRFEEDEQLRQVTEAVIQRIERSAP